MSSGGTEKRGSASTVKACDICRKKKRRCFWQSGTAGCTACVNLGETCTTTHVRKSRSKLRKGDRIAEYENKVKELEALLQKRSAEQPQIGRPPLLRSGESSASPSAWTESLRHEVKIMPHQTSPKSDPYDVDPLIGLSGLLPPEVFAALRLHETDQDTRPSESSISAVGIAGAQLDESETEATSPQSATPGADVGSSTDNNALPPLSSPSARDFYLPPADVAMELLAEYLNDVNAAIPIYQPDVLANYLRICYTGGSEDDVIAWTSTYLVFGLAYALRAHTPAASAALDKSTANYYLLQIQLSLDDLLKAPPSLSLAQCLLGTSLLISHLPSKYHLSESHFISTAFRIMYDNCTSRDFLADQAFAQQQCRVFWVAFIGDTMTSMLTTSPTTYQHKELVMCSPESADFLLGPLAVVTGADNYWGANILNLRIKLALVQAEANDQVLSKEMRHMSSFDVEFASTIILARLRELRKHEIFRLSLEDIVQGIRKADICHLFNLEATYFSTVYRLHAFVAYEKVTWVNPFSLEGLKATSELRHHRSYKAAHWLLSLLPIAPQGDIGLYWHSHRPLIAALVTVLAHHINNPTAEPPAPGDVQVYSQFLVDLGEMVHNSGNLALTELRDLCTTLFLKLQHQLQVSWSGASAKHHGGAIDLHPQGGMGSSGSWW